MIQVPSDTTVDPDVHVSRLIAVTAISVLLANPAILYLVTQSIWITIAASVAAIGGLIGAYAFIRRKLITVYIFNFAAIISLFLYAEAIFVHAFGDYVIEDLYTIESGYYFNKPYLNSILEDKEYIAAYMTNSQGFRIGYGHNPDESISKADWLFIGDSYTQGAQVNFEELYTTRLYSYFPDQVIVNAGISGFGIAEEYNYYAQSGHKLDADHVVLQLCSFNDFMKVYEKEVGVSDYLAHYSAFIRFLLQDIKYENPAELPLGRWTEPFYPDDELNANYNVFYRQSSDQKERDLAAFAEYMARFVAEVERNGAKFTVVLIPTKEQVSFRYFAEVLQAFDIHPADLDMTRPNRFLQSLSDSLGFELIDLLDTFQATSEDEFFSYDEHLNIYGHRVLADALAQELGRDRTRPAPRVLSREFVGDRYPSYSSDNRWIIYQSPTDGNQEIYIADTSFAAVRRLTYNDVDESHPTMSPDATSLVFTEGSAETFRTRVCMLDLDGSSRKCLTEGDTFGAIPTYSPDGRKLAYAEWKYDPESELFTQPQVILLDIISGEKQVLTGDSVESWRPVISASGDVVYISKRNGQFDLFLYDSLLRVERRLTKTPFDEWDPQFSPDGSLVVYAAHADDNWDLFLLDLRSGRRHRITQSTGDEWDPSFAPELDRIIYAGQFGSMKGIFELPLRLESQP